ncbi:bifunctional aspartate kinase/homoserine dehydrogenase I [Flavisolibacter tropicus]|uniref:Aspartate kinase n=1 Tax=Flavisolibacter tropicus TaxID=1492898 RepID=A0A172TQW0_9BACT|nr:bifunctional aspartate kinase/homoserine dehydrogenase I [Flavisolibacter tropicus]ANE49465.1 aspartate kinase [Flavisolibacter tropicus]
MQVLKFGGSSVATPDAIRSVASILQAKKTNEPLVVVVSALGKITDQLLQCGSLAATGNVTYKELIQSITQRHLDMARELVPVAIQSSILSFIIQQFNELEDICNSVYHLKELSDRTIARILSFGEQLSSHIVSTYLNTHGITNTWLDATKHIVTDSNYLKAVVNFPATNKSIQSVIPKQSDGLWIVPGFIASDEEGRITILGRGGSDYTAAIFAAALQASVLEIWTDVSGMMTADPREVKHAKVISRISYQEAMELSHFGAKVIYPPTLQPAMQLNIPVWIKNTFAPEDHGTIIESNIVHTKGTICGISSIANISLISLEGSGMIGIPGYSKLLFETLASCEINVILITQASSEHSICVGIEASIATKAKKALDKAFAYEINRGMVNPIVVEQDLSIIALVGDNMKNHAGTSGKMFGALGRNGINVRAISQGSSERNISAVIASADVKKAINVLHEEFFETTYKQVNVFIIGTGNVGSRLLAQIKQQQAYLQKNANIQLRVIGIANSRRMLFEEHGIDLNQLDRLDSAEPMDLQAFINRIQTMNLRNSVFVDVTASNSVANTYADLFLKSISVVACNKIACSSAYNNYQHLKGMATDRHTSFLFETNVGAGLPVIGTLNDLLRSGDAINEIHAVLSGTLNFVFNNYDGTRSFATVVKQAQDEGYTEPDPRLDLGGTDVMRKIMILAREAGARLEMEQIVNHSFMPASCMEGSVENFYSEMERQEAHFKKLYTEATANGKKLKFVANYKNGEAAVGLQQIDPQHDFYHLYGKDNIVLFYTNRYKDQPMVIKGAGAGAEVTASGVFADIIRAASV